MSNYADALRRSGPGDEPKKNIPVPTTKSQQTQGHQNPDARTGGRNGIQSSIKSFSAPEGTGKYKQPGPSSLSKAAHKAPESSKPPSKKFKKPKPKLKNMSLGDLIDSKLPLSQRLKPLPAVSSETTILKKPAESEPAQVAVSSSFQMDDFPSLASAAHQPSETTKPSSLPAGASWGSRVKQAPAKVKKELVMRQEKKTAPPAAKKKARKAKVKIEEPPPKSIMDSFVAKQRTEDGREHDLLKLMQEGKIKTHKGRQRITPRRKKFTTLKKKVLEERLRRWKETHPEEVDTKSSSEEPTSMQVDSDPKMERPSCTVCITGFANAEELEDEDEYEEILANLREMAEKVGPVKDLFVPRAEEGEDDCRVYVLFSKAEDAVAAISCWDGLVVGGQILSAAAIDLDSDSESIEGPSGNQWRSSISAYGRKGGASDGTGPLKIRLENILAEDDLTDEDCLQETLNDLRSMLEKFGPVDRIDVERDIKALEVIFGSHQAAQNAQSEMDGAVIGGNLVTASLVSADTVGSSTLETSFCTVALQNVITQDDLVDKDSLDESLRDIRIMAEKFGAVRGDVQVNRHDCTVLVTFEGPTTVAKHASDQFNGMSLGGQTIVARVLEDSVSLSGPVTSWVYLYNMLTEDDIEDPDSLEETKQDVAELAGQFGVVESVEVEAGESGHLVKIGYEGDTQISQRAVDKLNQMVFGGQPISAVAVSGSSGSNGEHLAAEAVAPAAPEATAVAPAPAAESDKPLYSGDKLIPERFAEAKRVPKITETQGSRHYATVIDDGAVKPLLIEMLGELMRLQKRAVEEKNTKARRRLVMGLREVARGIRSNKVKMIVMANNLDDYGVIDDKLQEILDLAKAQDVPVFFEFNKRHLGKAIGKNIKIGVIGIQNAEGAHQQFKQLSSLARKHGL